MYTLYSISLFFLRIAYGFLSLFEPKIRQSIEGRKQLFPELEKYYLGDKVVGGTLNSSESALRVGSTILPSRKRIVIHVSSFGELEQAKPVISSIKEKYPNVHIHLTFFSPSGYENAKDKYSEPDFISYLPFDTRSNVKRFLDLTKPDLILFVRYDLWHNFVHEAHDRNIPMLLFSATFDPSIKKSLPLIRKMYRNTYSFMTTICTTSEADTMAIEQLTIRAKNKIVTAGDTRCDQVIKRRNLATEGDDKILPEAVLQKIASEHLKVFIAGSTWEADEHFIFPVLGKAILSQEKILTIIVPHEINRSYKSYESHNLPTIKLSEISNYNGEKIIIVDSIGKLFSLYHYATFVYVGGGFGSGVHNILEPAVWGAPSIVGPNHKRSKEIGAMIGLSGAVEIQSQDQFEDAFHKWLANDMSRTLAAAAAKDYVYSSKGATQKVISEIIHLL